MILARNYREVDNIERFQLFKKYSDGFKGKTLLDIGCHNGWFCQHFILNGGISAVGVEPNETLFAECMSLEMKNFEVVHDISEVGDRMFDVVFFLDVQYHKDIDYLEFCKNHGKLCFISAAGNPDEAPINNERIRQDLKKVFTVSDSLGTTEYVGRRYYRCS